MATVQHWEYKFVQFAWTGRSGFSGYWAVKFIDSVEQKDWRKGPTVVTYCKQLGGEGWELVNAVLPPNESDWSGFAPGMKRVPARSSPASGRC